MKRPEQYSEEMAKRAAEAEMKVTDLREEIRMNREDYETRRVMQDEKLALAHKLLAAQTARADNAEYKVGRQKVRVEALLYALVLAQENNGRAQDEWAKLRAEHARCDKLAVAE